MRRGLRRPAAPLLAGTVGTHDSRLGRMSPAPSELRSPEAESGGWCPEAAPGGQVDGRDLFGTGPPTGTSVHATLADVVNCFSP